MLQKTRKLKVALIGRSQQALESLAEVLARAPDIACSTHLIADGQRDPLSGLAPLPDVLVLRFDGDSLAELEALAKSSPDGRPPLIVVGPAGSAEAVRLAVRSGARDFLPEPVNGDELITALGTVHDDRMRGSPASRSAQVTVVLGAAGGVGTSLVACNLAVALATDTRTPTLLLDLDVNAAPLAGLLDLTPERGLPAALGEVEYLDEHALQGYVSKHRSGLHVMGAAATAPVPLEALDPARFATLLEFLKANYRYIVVDGARHLDPLTLAAIGAARTVVLVLQQSVAQLKQAAVLIGWLGNVYGIPKDHILVLVNRYLKRSTVTLDDIRRALGRDELTVLPSHYKSVLASIDSGVPLIEYDHTSPVTRAILELQQELVSGHHVERPGLLRRALPIFSGG